MREWVTLVIMTSFYTSILKLLASFYAFILPCGVENSNGTVYHSMQLRSSLLISLLYQLDLMRQEETHLVVVMWGLWYPCWALLSLVILRSCRILYISLILFRFAWKMFVGHTCWLCLHDSHVKYPRRGKATCNIGGRVSGFLVIVCLCLFSSMVKYSILSLISAIICDQYHHLPQL